MQVILKASQGLTVVGPIIWYGNDSDLVWEYTAFEKITATEAFHTFDSGYCYAPGWSTAVFWKSVKHSSIQLGQQLVFQRISASILRINWCWNTCYIVGMDNCSPSPHCSSVIDDIVNHIFLNDTITRKYSLNQYQNYVFHVNIKKTFSTIIIYFSKILYLQRRANIKHFRS